MSLKKRIQAQLDSHVVKRIKEDDETMVILTEDGTKWLFTETGMKLGIDGRLTLRRKVKLPIQQLEFDL